MAVSNLAQIFTVRITSSTIVIPDGFLELFIVNHGSGNCTWQGNIATNPPDSKASTTIVLAAGEAYSYGYIGRGRKTLTLDATATTIDVSYTI